MNPRTSRHPDKPTADVTRKHLITSLSESVWTKVSQGSAEADLYRVQLCSSTLSTSTDELQNLPELQRPVRGRTAARSLHPLSPRLSPWQRAAHTHAAALGSRVSPHIRDAADTRSCSGVSGRPSSRWSCWCWCCCCSEIRLLYDTTASRSPQQHTERERETDDALNRSAADEPIREPRFTEPPL